EVGNGVAHAHAVGAVAGRANLLGLGLTGGQVALLGANLHDRRERQRDENPELSHIHASLSPVCQRPQSHAAPRTPLESPCIGGSNRVATWSENTCGLHSTGTVAYSRCTLDIPPPSTITSGSRMLITPASERARRSS